MNSARFLYHHHTESQIPFASHCAIVSAQCTSVYAATLLVVTRVIGSGFAAAARYCAMCWAIGRAAGGSRTTADRARGCPATAALPSDVAAIQHGRVRVLHRLRRDHPAREVEVLAVELEVLVLPHLHDGADRLVPLVAALVARHAERGLLHRRGPAGAPLDAPVDRMSAVATFSATRIGGVNACGISVTPKPRRRFSVHCDSAPMITSGAGRV